ncbi:MBL fold metallo-hydrolase [bacterium]|nr:MBL fold metallo-hydrolase [bacterium]
MNNPKLKTIKNGYQGNPISRKRFHGPYTSNVGKSFLPILKWKLSKNPRGQAKKTDTFRLQVLKPGPLPASDQNYLLWLGHASFLLQLGGKTILIDPCLSTSPFYKRYVDAPMEAGQIQADYLLVSHVHYDHLDKATLQALPGKNTLALLPLRVGRLVKKMNPRIHIQEAGWYQQFETDGDVEIYFLPARHWNRRGPNDLNRFLWGSYIIRYQDITLYFAGDTGYDTHFKEIRALFPKIDYALLPIAAYDPAFVMQDNHMNPAEAVQAFLDLEAKICIPMHYGTFDLTDEPPGEPLQWFLKEIKSHNLNQQVRVMDIGKVMRLPMVECVKE